MKQPSPEASDKSLPGEAGARRRVMLPVLAGWGVLGCWIGQAFLLGRAVDAALAGQSIPVELFGLFALLVVGRALCAGGARMASYYCAADLKQQTRAGIFSHLLKLGSFRAASDRTGGLVFDTVEGVEALDNYYGLYWPQLIVGLTTPLLVCLSVALVDWVTGLVMLVAAPLAPLLLGVTSHRFKTVSQRYHSAANVLSAQFLDSVQGLPTLKMFNRGAAQGAEIHNLSETLRRETMGLLAVNQLAIFLLDSGFTLFVTVVTFAVAAWRWEAGALSAGAAVAALLLSVEIVRQLNLLGAFFFAGAQGRVAIQKVREFLDRKPAVLGAPHRAMSSRPAEINFANVKFAYQEDEKVLDGVSLTVQAGETVAIAGASGAGKSSLIHLLLRFSDPQSGSIFLGGRRLIDLPLRWLREQIAVVAQDTWIFHGTIADNLRLARPNATRREMEHALELACLRDFVKALPEGLDTLVGERGARLSGGQAQRLAIARAMLKNAPILVLDEPTSDLDAGSEKIVISALEHLAQRRTVLHITHRLHTVGHADRLVFMRHGRIIGERPPVAA